MMKSALEVSRMTGVTKRTLQYYEKEGLLLPTKCNENGYRYYDNEAIKKLYEIRFLKELGYKLSEIKGMSDLSQFDRKDVENKIIALEEEKKKLERKLRLANVIQICGDLQIPERFVGKMSIEDLIEREKGFCDPDKVEAHFRKRHIQFTIEDYFIYLKLLIGLVELRNEEVWSEEVQSQAGKIHRFFLAHTEPGLRDELKRRDDICLYLDEDTEKSLDEMYGSGTAAFVQDATDYYYERRSREKRLHNRGVLSKVRRKIRGLRRRK